MGPLDAFHARYSPGMHVMVSSPVIIIEHRLVFPLPVLHFLREVHLWLLYRPFRFGIHRNEQAITFILVPAVFDTRGTISSLPFVSFLVVRSLDRADACEPGHSRDPVIIHDVEFYHLVAAYDVFETRRRQPGKTCYA